MQLDSVMELHEAHYPTDLGISVVGSIFIASRIKLSGVYVSIRVRQGLDLIRRRGVRLLHNQYYIDTVFRLLLQCRCMELYGCDFTCKADRLSLTLEEKISISNC